MRWASDPCSGGIRPVSLGGIAGRDALPGDDGGDVLGSHTMQVQVMSGGRSIAGRAFENG
jgi:hypothetical protein